MELKLYIRQKRLVDKNGQEEHIGGQRGALQLLSTPLPAHRRFPKYGSYLDITQNVSDLHKLKLTWTLERNTQGIVVAGTTNQKKAASRTLTFEGAAYSYLKQWLVDDLSAAVNVIEVQLEDTSCKGVYTGWVIKSTDLTWCEGGSCTFDLSLKQDDEALSCIKSTLVTNDWQGWFGNTSAPKSGKKHPRFSYCNEIRPNAIVITIWWTMTQLMSVIGPLMLLIVPIVNTIVWTLKYIIYPIINTILGILGKKKLDKDKLKELRYREVKDIFGNFFIESAGCGREHPAPLVRDYIANVCTYCGVDVTADSVPVFFAQQMKIETAEDRANNRMPDWRPNPHYNACYFNGVVDKGIRRFDNLNIFQGATKNQTDWWTPGNAPLLTLNMLLDELKTLYNADWRIENNTLYFKRKDHWLEDKELFDFSENGQDRSKLLDGICYEWDETKNPVYAAGIYSADAADVCGNTARNQMNGYVSYGDVRTDPKIEGVQEKTTKFGATKFRLDGASNDYVFDAMQQVINTTLITGSVWTTSLFSSINQFFRTYANYALLLRQETATLPKILLWDGATWDNAKCIAPYHASVSLNMPTPAASTKYNPNGYLWEWQHVPHTKVLGRKLVPPPQPVGAYEVRGLFGALVTLRAAKLVNYPMYFAPGYQGSLWDWFHWIDDPRENPRQYKKFTIRMKLCCDILDEVKPFYDAGNIMLGQKVRLPGPAPNAGRVTEVEVSYDVSDNEEPYIQLKGTV